MIEHMRILAFGATLMLAACAAPAPPLGQQASTVASTASPTGSARPTTALPASQRIEDLVAQFRYDASSPPAVRQMSASRAGAIDVTEIEYGSARGAIATATLLVPDGTSRRPALVMSPGSNQGRGELRNEGLALATDLSAVVLIVDQSQIAMHRERVWTFTPQDREEAIASVIDLRRGLDLLAARPDVDAARLGVHGFSYGAWLSAITAAIDPRVSTAVLRSGGPQILAQLAGPARSTAAGFASYLETMATVDQSRYAPAIPSATAVLVQNGTADQTYPAEGVRAWQAAIGGAKTARTYDGAGHDLDAAANSERLVFLRARWQPRTP